MSILKNHGMFNIMLQFRFFVKYKKILNINGKWIARSVKYLRHVYFHSKMCRRTPWFDIMLSFPCSCYGKTECEQCSTSVTAFNTLRPRQNGRLFADDIFKCIFLNENIRISNKNSLKFVPEGLINNIPALVQIMAWRRPGDKPLSEPMMVWSPTHICVTRPQWVKGQFWLKSEFFRMESDLLENHVLFLSWSSFIVKWCDWITILLASSKGKLCSCWLWGLWQRIVTEDRTQPLTPRENALSLKSYEIFAKIMAVSDLD